MTALAQARPGSIRTVKRDKRPVAAGAKGYKGGLAEVILSGANRGYYKQGDATIVGKNVGRFSADFDNTSGANGDISVEIDFEFERTITLWANDAGTAVVVGDRESACYVLDDQTVTGAVSLSVGGSVYDVTSEGVWVEARSAGAAGTPRIQKGTSTLIAGTKTVTGVSLTSTSVILLTMRDPGAGAITGLGAFDAPVASRNTSTGQFVVNAIDDSKALISSAVCTFDYVIVG